MKERKFKINFVNVRFRVEVFQKVCFIIKINMCNISLGDKKFCTIRGLSFNDIKPVDEAIGPSFVDYKDYRTNRYNPHVSVPAILRSRSWNISKICREPSGSAVAGKM